jgi:phosphoglycolate phosphatase-like HAD superfamily hydrolase
MDSLEVVPGGVNTVAFDWDGTVVDSVEPKLKQNQALAAEFGNGPLARASPHDLECVVGVS